MSTGAAPDTARALPSIDSQLTAIGEELYKLTDTLRSIGDNAFGPIPRPASPLAKGATDAPVAGLERVYLTISSLRFQVSEIGEQVKRFHQLV